MKISQCCRVLALSLEGSNPGVSSLHVSHIYHANAVSQRDYSVWGEGGLLQHDRTTHRVFVDRGLRSRLYYRCRCKMFHNVFYYSLQLKSCIISENTKERGVLNRFVKYGGCQGLEPLLLCLIGSNDSNSLVDLNTQNQIKQTNISTPLLKWA
jgi:hypothetical protein